MFIRTTISYLVQDFSISARDSGEKPEQPHKFSRIISVFWARELQESKIQVHGLNIFIIKHIQLNLQLYILKESDCYQWLITIQIIILSNV